MDQNSSSSNTATPVEEQQETGSLLSNPTNPSVPQPNKKLLILTGIILLLLLGGIMVFGMNSMNQSSPQENGQTTPPVTTQPTSVETVVTPTFSIATTTPVPQISPMTINGSAQVKAGEIVPGETVVEALINDIVCGSTTTRATTELTTNFTLQVKSVSQQVGCGDTNSIITFTVNGEKAMQNVPFRPDEYSEGISKNVILNVRY